MHSFSKMDFACALKTAQSGQGDTQSITRILPGVIEMGDAATAFALVNAYSNRNWLPEAMMLLNTPGLLPKQLQQMIGKIFIGSDNLNAQTINTLACCSARFGSLSFSFPQWRYVAQAVNGKALLEHFGMQRLQRITDLRDATLPDPERDLFGVGFNWIEDNWYVEYRRAYVICSQQSTQNPITFIIRNNSYFFGRDRLPAPVLISFEPMTVDDLQNLKPQNFLDESQFMFWENIASSQTADLQKKLDSIEIVQSFFDRFDQQLSNWLFSKGLSQLEEFVIVKFSNNKNLPFIGAIDPKLPPWYPQMALPITLKLLQDMQANQNEGTSTIEIKQNLKIILFTGEQGDLPVRSVKKATSPIDNSNKSL